jgi:PAS domain S-box-containing protein
MTPEQFLSWAQVFPEPLFLVSGTGTVLAANAPAGELVGTSGAAIRGQAFVGLVTTPATRVNAYLRACARTRAMVVGALTFRHADGRQVRCRTEGAVLQPWRDGSPAVLLIRCRSARQSDDPFGLLNERLQALTKANRQLAQVQEALREQRDWLEGVLSSIGDAVMTTDPQGLVTFMNGVAASLTGWQLPEAAGRDLAEVFRIVNETTHETIDNPVLKVIQKGTIVGLANHTLLIAKDGREVPIDDSAAPIRDRQGHLRGVVLVFRDITERRRLEEAQDLLAEAGALLSASLDYQETLAAVTRLTVPRFADWCTIYNTGDDGSPHVIALAHRDAAQETVLRELHQRYPPDSRHTPTVVQVTRSGQSIFYPELSAGQFQAAAHDGYHLELLQRLQPLSYMVVPLVARGRTLGVIAFGTAESGRRYGPADVAFAEELARRCAMAVDNARLYQEAQAATRAKEESLALLDMLFTAAPVGLGFFDRELRYVRVNQTLADINGLPVEAHPGRTPHEVNPQLTSVLDPLRRAVLETGQPVVNTEVSGETPKAPGQRQHWLVSYYPVRTSGGELLGVGVTVTDITARKHAEEELRQTRDELERRVQERTAQLAQANEVLRREIAERQQAEAELQRQRDALYQREKLAAMGSLLASVAHELNNPLSILMMQADLLREENRDGPLAEHGTAIAQAAERCMRIVHNFLTLARHYPPERQAVNLNAVVERAVDLLDYALRVDNIMVEWRLADDLPTLQADPHQLHQVVVNLVTNAHQALREVPQPRHLMLTTHYDRARAMVILEVADTGPGIPPAVQARIFEPFFTTKPPGVGTGLGLSLCRGIVEGHGGVIGVQSQPGRGTCFRVELPVEVTAPPQPELLRTDGLLAERAHPVRVLVIDDEPGITSALAYLLRRSGYAVEMAANGRIALAKLQEQQFEVILCDLRMPELDGPGFYEALQQHYPNLVQRIIFLTGDTLSPEARAFLEKADVPRLAKPFRAADVRRLVQQVLQASAP